jgi:serine protease Do
MRFGMAWKRAGLVSIVLAALAIVGYGQTSTKPRTRSANMQGAPSGYLGVAVGDLTVERMRALNLKDNAGVLVTVVTGGQAAERAGIHINDVILEINGQKVDSSERFMGSIIGKAPGTKVSLTVARNGVKQNMVATLGTRPPDLPVNAVPLGVAEPGPFSPEELQLMIAAQNAVEAPKVGFDGLPLGQQLAEYFGVREGVLVVGVTANTSAEKAGLKAGDVVTKVNGMPVANPREITGIVRQMKKVIFTVVRNKKEITLNFEIAWNRSDSSERELVN